MVERPTSSLVEESQRARVVAEALSWVGTPWVHFGRIKGAGVDCAMLIAEVFERAGIVGHVEVPAYPIDWHLHREESKFADFVATLAPEVDGPPDRTPLPGDIIVWHFHAAFAHGGIVTAWPKVVHSYSRSMVCEDDCEAAAWLSTVIERTPRRGQARARRFFNAWAKATTAPC